MAKKPRQKRRTLSPDDANLLSASRDLGEAAQLAIRYLRLTAAGESDADIETAFQRAAVVLYVSPWSQSEDKTSTSVVELPSVLTRAEHELHEHLLDMRHNVFAHTNRQRTDPAKYVNPDGLTMFGRNVILLGHRDVAGLWYNAIRLSNYAHWQLRKRHPDVFPINYQRVGPLTEVVTLQRARRIMKHIEEPLVQNLVLHGWTENDYVTLDDAARRLGIARRLLSSFANESARRDAGFPEPLMPSPVRGEGPHWTMKAIRAWWLTRPR